MLLLILVKYHISTLIPVNINRQIAAPTFLLLIFLLIFLLLWILFDPSHLLKHLRVLQFLYFIFNFAILWLIFDNIRYEEVLVNIENRYLIFLVYIFVLPLSALFQLVDDQFLILKMLLQILHLLQKALIGIASLNILLNSFALADKFVENVRILLQVFTIIHLFFYIPKFIDSANMPF